MLATVSSYGIQGFHLVQGYGGQGFSKEVRNYRQGKAMSEQFCSRESINRYMHCLAVKCAETLPYPDLADLQQWRAYAKSPSGQADLHFLVCLIEQACARKKKFSISQPLPLMEKAFQSFAEATNLKCECCF